MLNKGSRTKRVGITVAAMLIGLGAGSLGVCPFLPTLPPISNPTPLPTVPTTVPTTAVPTATTTATATPTPATLYNFTITASASLTSVSIFPTNFFTAAGNQGDITYNPNGTTFTAPPSATRTVTVVVTGPNATSRPQIQFQEAAAPNLVVYTAPQNTTTNVLTASFVPNSTSQLRFSVIDTNQAAAGLAYTILITQ